MHHSNVIVLGSREREGGCSEKGEGERARFNRRKKGSTINLISLS